MKVKDFLESLGMQALGATDGRRVGDVVHFPVYSQPKVIPFDKDKIVEFDEILTSSAELRSESECAFFAMYGTLPPARLRELGCI